MGEQVAVEGGVVIQEAAQIKGRAGGGEVSQADLSRCDDGPIALSGDPVVGVGGPLSHCLEDHGNILVNEATGGAWGSRGPPNTPARPRRRSAGVDLLRTPPRRGGPFRYLSH